MCLSSYGINTVTAPCNGHTRPTRRAQHASSPLLAALALLALVGTAGAEPTGERSPLDWSQLPDLPVAVSGHFAGVASGKLIVAGGAHFPTPLFEGGEKVWVDDVYALAPDADAWRHVGQLPAPSAYGGSITTEDGLICIGGGDAKRHSRHVYRIELSGDDLRFEDLPALPRRCAFCSAAILGKTIYVVGGREAPDSPTALHTLWSLDLEDTASGWRELEPWPGPPLMLAVVAAQAESLFVISGVSLVPGPDGQPVRRYHTEGYRYSPGRGWTTMTSAPQPIVAAPAIAAGQSHVLAFSGDDGALADQVWTLKDKHPGFSHSILAYHTITGQWTTLDEAPCALVTTNVVEWNGRFVIPGGEDRPGHRAAAVHAATPKSVAVPFGALNFTALGLYLASLIVMGWYFSRRENSTEMFFLGGRRVPWLAAGISIFGTQLSAITFMAIPAKAYATNWVYLLANLCIPIVAPLVVFIYLPFFRRLNVTTAYEYLEMRFSVPVRLFGSLTFLLLQLGRMGIVLFLPAIALSTVTGLDIYGCILVMGLLATIYTVMGGVEAVIWTDVVQVIVLLGGALLSLGIIVWNLDGGMSAVLSVGAANDKFHLLNWSWDYTITAVWVVVLGNIFSNLVPYTSDQTVVQRYLTTRDERRAASSVWAAALLAIPASVLFFGLGTALFVYYRAMPEHLSPWMSTDAIFPWFISHELPPGISGIVVAGLFAAAMSSLDTSMNSGAAVIVHDFLKRFSLTRTERAQFSAARWLTLALGVFGTATALLMATYEVRSLWDVFLTLIGLFGGSLAGVFALGVFSRRANASGALLGAACSVIALYWVRTQTDVHFFLYAAIGIVTCFCVGYVSSLVLPGRRGIPDVLYGATPRTGSAAE